jgi:outer membrane protein OmpA-like peptidoglycan-associated protein
MAEEQVHFKRHMSMKKFLLVVVHLVFPFQLLAQLSLFMKENFRDNRLGWYETEAPDHSMRIKNGYYEMIAPEGGWMTYIYPGLNVTKDFSIEATFTHASGELNNGFGFVWGYDEGSRLNHFVISSSGYVKVWSTDETRQDAKEWKKIEVVNPPGKANRLTLVAKKDEMKFLVNGHEVLSLPSLPWFGKTVGFISYTQMQLLIDNFAIYSDLNINLPPDLPEGLVKENLGPAINTAYDEVTPKISVDGTMIFFTRKKSPDNLGGVDDESDIWFSVSEDGEHWSPSLNMGPPINSEGVNNIVAISQDNNVMLVSTGNDFGVYERTGEGWKPGGKLGAHYENDSDYFEASQSADGKSILFSARSKKNLFYSDDFNERDLFVVLKDANGKWSNPINLGPAINTSGTEMSPFLASDGRTLYFASDGHPGYGGMDIFMSKRLDDTWTNWSQPVNLGPEINTFGFDAYYTMPASGEVAYMCTSEGGYGRSDLVRVKLPKAVKPDPVVLVVGRVLNAKTKNPVQAQIVFENIQTGREAGEAVSNPTSGAYRIALPYGVNYGLHARAKGYISVNENLELVSLSDYVRVDKDLLLVPIEVGEAIQLNNVFFEQGRPLLKPESYPELDRLVTIMNENPGMVIELGGHTDNVGNPRSLVVLSQERVSAVKKYLVQHGIAAKRITGKGHGGAMPLMKNDTEENRRMNRRVEFKIVKK